MKPVPWSNISFWNCIACGECCKEYTVNISFGEWRKIIKRYGFGKTSPRLTEFYIKKRLGGRCVFQYRSQDSHWLCTLQDIKPKVCKIWPFKIYSKPIYGWGKKALFFFEGKPYYVYIDPNCRGIQWGNPSEAFVKRVIPEFIQLANGKIKEQTVSTSYFRILPPILSKHSRNYDKHIVV